MNAFLILGSLGPYMCNKKLKIVNFRSTTSLRCKLLTKILIPSARVYKLCFVVWDRSFFYSGIYNSLTFQHYEFNFTEIKNLTFTNIDYFL